MISLSIPVVYAQAGLPTLSTACENKTGIIYSVNDGFSFFKNCFRGDREVILLGQKGDKGDTGATGMAGVTGATGPQGLSGDPGPIGATGQQGFTGEIGATGLSGDMGPLGATGAIGQTGSTGPTGLQGLQGATGPQGPAGITGAGNIAFIFDDRANRDALWVLTTDGKVWIWNSPWTHYANGGLDVPIDPSNIVQWQPLGFLDKSGNAWFYTMNTWKNEGHP